MLRNKADVRVVLYMIVITTLLIIQWRADQVYPLLCIFAIWMAVPVAVIAHNHNHLPVWKSDKLNMLQDYWLTLFYGFPAFAWIPTHNTNHHIHNNREPDYTITYRVSESNNLFTLLTYPSVSGGAQQKAIYRYMKDLWKKNKKTFFYNISQLVALVVFLGVALWMDWKKAVLFIVLPQQFSLFSVLIFNYIQHVHADEESKWNHSRNFVGAFMNGFLFNNGYHTVHHMHPRRHWSENEYEHHQVSKNIDPILMEKNFSWYMFRVYILGPIMPRFKTLSMRVQRKARLAQPTNKIFESKNVSELALSLDA
jgi:beta-carotene hydroxylase